MSRVSTALLTVGPRSLAPWGDRAWRIAATAQLVEGSTPYWIVSATKPAQHHVRPLEIEVPSPHADSVIESILYLLGCHFGDEEIESYLVETHNITVYEDSTRELAQFFELADQTREFLANRLASSVRLGFVKLDDLSLVTDEVIQKLRELGFDVEAFSQDSLAAI